jgi:hypothetical protein
MDPIVTVLLGVALIIFRNRLSQLNVEGVRHLWGGRADTSLPDAMFVAVIGGCFVILVGLRKLLYVVGIWK